MGATHPPAPYCSWRGQRCLISPPRLPPAPHPHSVDVQACFSYTATPASYSPPLGERTQGQGMEVPGLRGDDPSTAPSLSHQCWSTCLMPTRSGDGWVTPPVSPSWAVGPRILSTRSPTPWSCPGSTRAPAPLPPSSSRWAPVIPIPTSSRSYPCPYPHPIRVPIVPSLFPFPFLSHPHPVSVSTPTPILRPSSPLLALPLQDSIRDKLRPITVTLAYGIQGAGTPRHSRSATLPPLPPVLSPQQPSSHRTEVRGRL